MFLQSKPCLTIKEYTYDTLNYRHGANTAFALLSADPLTAVSIVPQFKSFNSSKYIRAIRVSMQN